MSFRGLSMELGAPRWASGKKRADDEEDVEEYDLELDVVVGHVADGSGEEREARQAALREAEEARRRQAATLDYERFKAMLPPADAELITEDEWHSFEGWMRRQDFYYDGLALDDYVESYAEWTASGAYVEGLEERRQLLQQRIELGEYEDNAELAMLTETLRKLTAWLRAHGWTPAPLISQPPPVPRRLAAAPKPPETGGKAEISGLGANANNQSVWGKFANLVDSS